MHFFLPRIQYTKERAKQMIDLMKGELARQKGDTHVTGIMTEEGLHIYSYLGMKDGIPIYDKEEPITTIQNARSLTDITNIP